MMNEEMKVMENETIVETPFNEQELPADVNVTELYPTFEEENGGSGKGIMIAVGVGIAAVAAVKFAKPKLEGFIYNKLKNKFEPDIVEVDDAEDFREEADETVENPKPADEKSKK